MSTKTRNGETEAEPTDDRDPSEGSAGPDEAPLAESVPLEGTEDLEAATPEELLAKAGEYRSLWQRAQADYKNARRRGLAEQEAAVRRALQPLLDDCLLVLDHLEMALLSPTESTDAKALAQGVELTRAQFVSILERNGVTPIPDGGEFNPALHQAMETVEDSAAEPGSVVGTLRRGFRWGDVVLRYAQVKVAASPKSADEESGDGND